MPETFKKHFSLYLSAHLDDLYCFHYTASNDDQLKRNGWDIYSPASEYHRMGVPNEAWSPTALNHSYE
ncbi:hypothetical protein SK128_024084, partial [Halocaridina rubra]